MWLRKSIDFRAALHFPDLKSFRQLRKSEVLFSLDTHYWNKLFFSLDCHFRTINRSRIPLSWSLELISFEWDSITLSNWILFVRWNDRQVFTWQSFEWDDMILSNSTFFIGWRGRALRFMWMHIIDWSYRFTFHSLEGEYSNVDRCDVTV
jgi:hypothetical protein